MKTKIQCPACLSFDNVKFVFVEHILNNGVSEISNPSDYHFIFACPNLHIHDGSKLIKPYHEK